MLFSRIRGLAILIDCLSFESDARCIPEAM
jgi:hypothetical protein